MSTCRRAGEAMLEADVWELLGRSDTELAAHVRSCPRCAGVARRILDANTALDTILAAAPPVDVDALLARARLQSVPTARADAPRARRVPASALKGWRRWAAAGVAASIVGVVFTSGREAPLPGVAVERREVVPSIVEPAGGGNVLVLQTGNPDITVLWFF